MKLAFRCSLFVFLLCSLPAFGQAYSGTAQANSSGLYIRAIPYAQVTLCVSTDTAVPCTTKANNYVDDSLSVLCTQSSGSGVLTRPPISGTGCNNPGITDANGNFTVFAAAGNYRLCVAGQSTQNVDCREITIATGGNGPFIQCPGAAGGELGAWTSTTQLGCDLHSKTDFAGNLQSQSYQAVGPYNGEVRFTTVGVVPPVALPSNTIGILAPNVVATPFRINLPPTKGTNGQVLQKLSESVDASGTTNIFLNWLTPSTGGGTQFQVNGLNLSNCSGSVCPLQNLVNATQSFGYGVNFADAGSGKIQPTMVTPFGQASNPTAPTLTPTNPGSTSYTYGVVGCEDPNCTLHSTLVTASTSTGNAIVNGTNPIALTAYADTLYGYRFYIVCRTATSGTPNTTGRIATGVWKKFTDTGQAGDGANCTSLYATNNTQLDNHCLGSVPSVTNAILSTPCGIDGPPSSPLAENDEFTWTGNGTFLPGDANDPEWITVNTGTNSFSMALTSGLLEMTSASQGSSASAHCIFQPITSTPASYAALAYPTPDSSNGSFNQFWHLSFRESATGKIEGVGENNSAGSNGRVVMFQYTSPTAQSQPQQVGTGGAGQPYPAIFGVKYDGTNVVFYSSTTGITYKQVFSSAKNAFFTTAPDQVGICLDNFNGAGIVEWDYFRRLSTQLP